MGMLFPWFQIPHFIFNFFAIFIDFTTIISDAVNVEEHTASGGFINAEFGHNDAGFTAAAAFDISVADDDLTHNGGFTSVPRATSCTSNEAIGDMGLRSELMLAVKYLSKGDNPDQPVLHWRQGIAVSWIRDRLRRGRRKPAGSGPEVAVP